MNTNHPISGGKLWELVMIYLPLSLYSIPMMVDVILYANVLTTVE